MRHQAELGGTHLSEVVTTHVGRLVDRPDVRMLTDVVKRTRPVVIEELTTVVEATENLDIRPVLVSAPQIRATVRRMKAVNGPDHGRGGPPGVARPLARLVLVCVLLVGRAVV